MSIERAQAIARSPHLVELAARSYQVRQALRLIETRTIEVKRDQRTMIVGPNCDWIELGNSRIELSKRSALQHLVHCFLAEHAASPGRGVSVEALFSAGWPGELITGRSAANRVYVAIATLRKQGLELLLLRGADGYFLDPELVVQRDHD